MTGLLTIFSAHPVASTLLAICLLADIGCPDIRKLAGTVTLDGENVPGGTVYFTDRANASVSSSVISTAGTYYVELVQSHTYDVTLTNAGAPGEGVIPERYGKISTSGLSYSANTGKTDEVFPYDIALTRTP